MKNIILFTILYSCNLQIQARSATDYLITEVTSKEHPGIDENRKCDELFKRDEFGKSVTISLKIPITIIKNAYSRLYFSVQKSTESYNNAPVISLSCLVNGQGCSYEFEILFADNTMLKYSFGTYCPTIIDCFSLNELAENQRSALLNKRITKMRFCGEVFEINETNSQQIYEILNCIK